MTTSANAIDKIDMDNLPTAVERFYILEKEKANDIAFVQPFPDGSIEEITWAEVGNRVRRMAAYFRSLNLEPGCRIALMSTNCAYWIMTDMAIWMSGHVTVPLYPILAPKTVRQIMEHSESAVMVVGKLGDWDTMKEGVPEGLNMVSFPLSPQSVRDEYMDWDQIMSDFEPIADSPVPQASDLATIIYTSGTTGMPKGVMHSFKNVAIVGTLSKDLYGLSDKDRMLSYLPLAHAGERVAVETSQLYCGLKVYFSNSLETFADDLRRARPTIFFAVPRIWTKFQQRVMQQVPAKKLSLMLKLPILSGITRKKLTSALGLDQVRVGISGAAPISTSLMDWYKKLGIDILEGYGMSENFAYSHSTVPGKAKIGYVGSPSPAVDCKLSEAGEILVKSPTNMLGYYKQPELTRETIDEEGYLHTGDKGEIDSEGRLKITGRIKEIFKTSKGKYVAPAPIEDILSQNTDLELLCVTGADMPQPIGLVTLSELAAEKLKDEVSKSSLLEALEKLLTSTNSKLDQHEQLSHLIVFPKAWTVENNLITPTLKIKRPEVERRYQSNFEKWLTKKTRVILELD